MVLIRQGLPRKEECKQTASTSTRGGGISLQWGKLLVTCKASVPTPNYQKMAKIKPVNTA